MPTNVVMTNLVPTDWQDQWIAENYPDALFFVDRKNGEIVVYLGYDEDGNDVT